MVLKKSLICLTLVLFPLLTFCQERIVGKFTTQTSTFVEGQQVALQGAGTTRTVTTSDLIVEGKVYRLYSVSRAVFEEPITYEEGASQQLIQQALMRKNSNYNFIGNSEANNKLCLFSGEIDKDKNIIYEAKLLEIYDDNKIINLLNKLIDKED